MFNLDPRESIKNANANSRILSCNDRLDHLPRIKYNNRPISIFGIVFLTPLMRSLSGNTSNTDDSRSSSLARLLFSCLKTGCGRIWKPFDSPTKSSHEVLFPSRAFFSMEFFTPVGFNEASSTTQQSHEQHSYVYRSFVVSTLYRDLLMLFGNF